MHSPDNSRLASFSSLEPEDLDSFALLTGPSTRLARGEYLRLEGTSCPEVYRLRSGWLACSVATADGGRQITKIHMPGDLVGVPSLAATEAAETIIALSDTVVETIPLEVFSRIFRNHPRLAAMLFLWANEERVHLMKQLTLVGQVRAVRRVAALLVSLCKRHWAGSHPADLSFTAPLTQEDVADATGISIVHANRCLRELRRRGLATWRDGVLTVHDLDGLSTFANVQADVTRDTSWI